MITQTTAAQERDIQLVLDHYALDESDFEKLDKLVDWEALAKYIENPTKVAVCNILDIDGKIVVSQDEPVRIHMEVPMLNAREELKKKGLVFVEWWD